MPFPPRLPAERPWWRPFVIAGWLAGMVVMAQEGDFEKDSLAWRTALHFDPASESSLSSLVELYQQKNRLSELIQVYAAHVQQYPEDENAAVVLARLYGQIQDPQAALFLEQALARHPGSALLHHVKAGLLMKNQASMALESLDQAVKLETQVPSRRSQWLGELMKAAAAAGRDDLLAARMKSLADEGAFTPLQRVQWARRCAESGMKMSAAAALAGGTFETLSGDEAVEAQFVQAQVALLQGDRAKAARTARDLLDLLAPEHWRRKEALLLHWQSADEAERQAALAETEKAWKETPDNEGASMAHGDLLFLAGRQDEALTVWQDSLQRRPDSVLLEERVVEALQTLRRDEELLAFLAGRMAAQPQRESLKLQRAEQLLLLGRLEEGLEALKKLLEGKDTGERFRIWMQAARRLRLQNLFNESARLLEALLQEQPERWEARKELAELYGLLQRDEEVVKLFETALDQGVSAEVRLETAQFLVSRKLWPQARQLLQSWLGEKPEDYEALLLLGRLETLAGQPGAAEAALKRCRELCDTEARYAAWLAAAWGRVAEQEAAAAWIEEERKRLWPQSGEIWDSLRLQKLTLLTEQTMASKVTREAEHLLRAALAEAGLPDQARRDLRLLLIRILDGLPEQRKALETELQNLLQASDNQDQEDLKLRLSLLYWEARRLDLAASTLRTVRTEACSDATLLQRSLTMARQMGDEALMQAFSSRLVRLQPDEKAHWITWTSLLAEGGDEAGLRLALREMRTRASTWKLSVAAQEILRNHLAASTWRTVSTALTRPEADPGAALLSLLELEQIERDPQRRLWLAWARGLLARHSSDEAGLATARDTLSSSGQEWVVMPDGLSMSLREALKQLDMPRGAQHGSTDKVSGDYSRPGRVAWMFEPMHQAHLQSWRLTPDGLKLLVQDTHGRLYAVDRRSGKLRWQVRLGDLPGTKVLATWREQGGEQVSHPREWCADDEHLCVLEEGNLYCLSLADGTLLWRASTPPSQAGSHGTIAACQGQVLWWQAPAGSLEALDLRTGKRRWHLEIPALTQKQELNPSSPVWLTSGIRVQGGRALVWGNGSAVVDAAKGVIQWKASLNETTLPLPLPLDAAQIQTGPGATAFLTNATSRRNPQGSAHLTPMTAANPLAMPVYGFPGMYGSTQGSPWLLWGSEGERWLQDEGVWLLGHGVLGTRYSILGLPVVRPAEPRLRGQSGLSGALPLGTAGSHLLVASERGLFKLLPDGRTTLLAAVEVRDNRPGKHPLPACAADGAFAAMVTQDEIRLFQTHSGSQLWSSPWPEDIRERISKHQESLQSWHSLRWSSRGLAFYDGRGHTLMLDWQARMSGGDLVAPAGTQALVCLRCTP